MVEFVWRDIAHQQSDKLLEELSSCPAVLGEDPERLRLRAQFLAGAG